MQTTSNTVITVETTVHISLEKVWEYWTMPGHITQWNNASDDWQTPRAENDLRIGGKFNYRMEAKDGSMGFDFNGIYTDVVPQTFITYIMEDGRKVNIAFSNTGNGITISESFEAETTNSLELQKTGWQAILDNFKKYAEMHA